MSLVGDGGAGDVSGGSQHADIYIYIYTHEKLYEKT